MTGIEWAFTALCVLLLVACVALGEYHYRVVTKRK